MMATSSAVVALPCGAWRHGVCHRDALLHAVTGADEMAVLDSPHGVCRAARVTALLACCVERVGNIAGEPIDQTVRSLSIGDREALLLRLRQLTFGDRIECVLACPACGEQLESELDVQRLLVDPPTAPTREWFEMTASDASGAYDVRLRLPTGADQEAIAALASTDPEAAGRALLVRCIDELRRDGVARDISIDDLSVSVIDRAAGLLSELDPQAELTLDLQCVACGHEFEVLFDTASFLLRELELHGGAIYREVHTLACHYHWSESEILAMTAAKRGRYLELIAEAAVPAVTPA